MSRRAGPRIERTRATGGDSDDPAEDPREDLPPELRNEDPPEDEADPDPEEEDPAPQEQGEDDEPDTSIADLVGDADPNRFDSTFLVEKEDIPAAPAEPWPIPQPWQGLPRLAFVVNINYVYDDEEEEWVRQRPFDGGERSRELVARDTVTVSSTGNSFFPTGLSGEDRLLETEFRVVTPGSLTQDLAIGEGSAAGFDSLKHGKIYRPASDAWEFWIVNQGGDTGFDIEFFIWEVSP